MLVKSQGGGLPGGSGVRNPAANAGDMGLIPNPGKSHASEQLSLCAATTEPGLYSLGASTIEPACYNC